MSSNEEDYNDGEGGSGTYQGSKKRRIQRACDICRRKKSDGVQMPANRCSNCIAYSFECTYVEAAKKRGPPKGYVESLENRVEKLDKLLRRLCPDETLYKELHKSLDNDWNIEQEPTQPSPILSSQASMQTLGLVTKAFRGANKPQTSVQLADDDDEAALILADHMRRLAMEPTEYRFFGKSSGAMLIHTALELKTEYTKEIQKPVLGNQRAEFWTLRPWERNRHISGPMHQYSFPEPDLAAELIDLYFSCMNLYLPLLHRPSFEKLIEEGLYREDDGFACVFLLVCAVGARLSDDPRARLDGEDSYHSCGWKWFDQVQMVKKSLLSPPSLYDLQFHCLSVQFLQGSSAPQSCWTVIGIGVRLAQDVGAHRRKIYKDGLTPEDELWKRAFWVLVCMDRMVSASLGRPCAIQDEDFDLDLPVDCDDEYWDNPDPSKRFKQPPNKPSLLSSFILYLKLNQILAFSLRTIYSINKSKILLGLVGQKWEQHIVAELDSALNQWVDSVPDHLRWDPTRENDSFFNQSASLYSSYYHIQILIHRPFIPSPSKPSPLSFPSLAICTNAARSCSHVVDIQRRRNPRPPPQTQMAAFTSGIVLLLSIWGGKRSGLSTDPNKEMADVHKCMQFLRGSEQRWHSAGRLWDILYELASVGELPLPQPSPQAANKRERDSETPISASGSDTTPTKEQSDAPRTIAGSRRLIKDARSAIPVPSQQQIPQSYPPLIPMPLASLHAQHRLPSPQPDSSANTATLKQQPKKPSLPHPPTEMYALPVYSNELGRLPLHGQFTFSAQTHAQQPPQPSPAMNSNSYWYNSAPLSGGLDGGDRSDSISIPSANSIPSSSSSSPPLQHHHRRSQQAASQSNQHQPLSQTRHASLYPPLSEMSSMTQDYGMESTQMPSGMMLDNVAVPMGYNNPHSSFINEARPLNTTSSSSINGEGFNRSLSVSMDTRGDAGDQQHVQQQHHRQLLHLPSHQHPQHQQNQNQHVLAEQETMNYGYLDNDTIAMWSNAPTGFELDEWGTYLSNVSELTHNHGQQHGQQHPA